MLKHKKIFWYVLSLCSAILLYISAIPSALWYLNFIAFIPFLSITDEVQKGTRPILNFALQLIVLLFAFYLSVGFWVLQTAHLGFIIGILIVIPFLILLLPYVIILKRNRILAYIYFVTSWMAAEFIQNYFELGSPFYNLGHSLGANPKLIQWYSVTGAAGGTFWILIVNIALYSLIRRITVGKRWISRAIIAICILVIPMLVSITMYYSYKEKGISSEILVVHPCTDNANVKYQLNIYDLLNIYLNIALPQITDQTDYVVFPETAITNTGWIKDYNRNLVFQHWFQQTANFPKLKLVTGAIAYEAIPNVEKIKHYKKIPGIRYSEKYKRWYYTYNTALQLEVGQPVQMRVKEGLVPYQEYAPYPRILPRMSPVGIDFQFSKREDNCMVFTSSNQQKTAALICYETVYSNLFAQATHQGAQAFFVLLNEGWYSKIKVSRQFLQLSVIRAIENRRSIAHCSNLGISAVINQRGDIIKQTQSKQATFLKSSIYMNRNKTIASVFGNYIGIIAIVLVVFVGVRELFQHLFIKRKTDQRF